MHVVDSYTVQTNTEGIRRYIRMHVVDSNAIHSSDIDLYDIVCVCLHIYTQ